MRVSFVETILAVLGTCLTCHHHVAGYRYNAQAYIKVFREKVKAEEDKLEVVIVGIKPMLDCDSFEPPEGSTQLPSDLPPRPILDRC